MTIHYGVLKCKVIGRRQGTRENPHYQLHVEAGGTHYRIAINVKSQLSPSELLYYTDEHFEHEVTGDLPGLPVGFTHLESKPGGMALDYIRGNLFDRRNMVPLAFEVPGHDNDLNGKLEMYMKRAMECSDAVLYAYGDVWGPEPKQPDSVFGFIPGNGLHDIHMNQGNAGLRIKDNGVYQDGGLLLHFPPSNRWIAIFLAFQSQSWHTEDTTGNPIHLDHKAISGAAGYVQGKGLLHTEHSIYIVGAVVKPALPTDYETVTLLNVTDRSLDLTRWSIANKFKRKYPLTGKIEPGQYLTVALTLPGYSDFLRQRGDIITLLDARGLKVHGVSYTRSQVRSGWTIRF